METVSQPKSKELVKVEEHAMTVNDVVGQVQLIQHIMKEVMKEGEHFGEAFPGSDKPSLLKPGAEKLNMTFRLAPKYEIQRYDLPGGHREYEITCNLYSLEGGNFVGSGIGSCNTMEDKYRFRSENTGKPVPKEYWQNRDPALIGGTQFKVRKKEKQWFIFEEVEYDRPQNYYNTVKKMAKKRAFVDAILTVTAASDIFTQDIEDMPAEIINGEVVAESTNSSQNSPKKSSEKGKKGASVEDRGKKGAIPWADRVDNFVKIMQAYEEKLGQDVYANILLAHEVDPPQLKDMTEGKAMKLYADMEKAYQDTLETEGE